MIVGDFWRATWDLRAFEADGYCGEAAELSRPERRFVRSVPGLEAAWDWGWSRHVDHLWLRCHLAPNHEGGHGTQLGYRPWHSLDFQLPGDFSDYDRLSRQWYLIWGPDQLSRRVIAPMTVCGVERSATGDANGKWSCGLWQRHPGTCRFSVVEEFPDPDPISIDLLPDIEDEGFEALDDSIALGPQNGAITSDEDAEILDSPAEQSETIEEVLLRHEEEERRRIVQYFLAGEATIAQLARAFDLDFEEARELIATRTTGVERTDARRRRAQMIREYDRASVLLWEAEWSRMDTVAGRRITRVAGRTVRD